jgi:hypothetical protein
MTNEAIMSIVAFCLIFLLFVSINKTYAEEKTIKQRKTLNDNYHKEMKDKYTKNLLKVKDAVQKAAVKHNIPYLVLMQLAFVESKLNPLAHNELTKARGLFQLTPITCKQLGVKNANSIYESADAAARYIKLLRKKFNSEREILAAWEYGPTYVTEFGVPNNIDYVNKYINAKLHLIKLYHEHGVKL